MLNILQFSSQELLNLSYRYPFRNTKVQTRNITDILKWQKILYDSESIKFYIITLFISAGDYYMTSIRGAFKARPIKTQLFFK